MATGLAIKAYTNIISGGYVGEDIGADRQYENWTEVPLSGSVVSTYYYHDSDYGRNSQSTKVTVSILDEWGAVLEPDNSFTITVRSYLTGIVRGERRGYAGSVGRSIMVRQGTSGAWLRQWLRTPVNAVQTIYSGRLLIGTKTWHLYPEGTPGQQSESSTGSIYYRNTTAGHEGDTPPSIYMDEFYMGINYKNTLPRKLHPPVVYQIDQEPDICHYMALVDFSISMDDFPIGDTNVHTVHLQVASDSNFTAPMDFYASATRGDNGMTYFKIEDVSLKPATTYYYRVQLDQPDLYETDWRYGDFDTISVIKPKEVAPEFSETDCETLTNNQQVAEWPEWQKGI